MSDTGRSAPRRMDDVEGRTGRVYLIGAGPGDAELMTLKAIKILGLCDVILIDSLVNPEILQFARQDALIIQVGKRGGQKSIPQSDINEQMIEFARRGYSVARLKGGDPVIFGRGGEEMQFLLEAGIEVSIVSGITSGIAIPAALQIPLTHRDLAQSVVFVSGSTREGGVPPDWQSIAAAQATILIYMGRSKIAEIVAQLLAGKLAPHTPAAAVQDGTLPEQRFVFSPLSELPRRVEQAHLSSPTIIVIGRTVALSPLWAASLETHIEPLVSNMSTEPA